MQLTGGAARRFGARGAADAQPERQPLHEPSACHRHAPRAERAPIGRQPDRHAARVGARVQRVPETESSGRLHTSAATVAVLPEVEDIDMEIKDSDIKIDTYRASGAGGQHVNKTESAIRVTHIPTGVVVTCQDESSQHKNKDKALKVLRSKIFEIQEAERNKERADQRKSMVSTGDRSAKIRTYNFPQGRMTDHRINLTLYKLNDIMDGDLEEIFESLKIENQKLLMNDA